MQLGKILQLESKKIIFLKVQCGWGLPHKKDTDMVDNMYQRHITERKEGQINQINSGSAALYMMVMYILMALQSKNLLIKV